MCRWWENALAVEVREQQLWYNLSSFKKRPNVFYKNNLVKVLKSRWARLRRIVLILGVAFLILWGVADVAIRVASSGRVYSKAKIAALVDVVIRRQPKFLGPLEKVPE